LCAVGGAGVALAVALPLTLSKTITLHSLDDVDRYLRKHVIQGPTDRTLGFSDHREFIDYAKNNFSDQFYLNTSLYSLIVLMDNMTSTMGGKTEDESERNASSQELRSSAVSCEIKDIKITKQTKHFQIN
jgi:hypothetical protein